MKNLFYLQPDPLSEGEDFLNACNTSGWNQSGGSPPRRNYEAFISNFDMFSKKLLGDGVEWLGGGENRSFRISAYNQTFLASDKSEIETALQRIELLSKKTSC